MYVRLHILNQWILFSFYVFHQFHNYCSLDSFQLQQNFSLPCFWERTEDQYLLSGDGVHEWLAFFMYFSIRILYLFLAPVNNFEATSVN
jgi:hypothetical protein